MAISEQFKSVIDMNQAKMSEKSIFRGERYRISILTDRLVRFEYNPTGNFYDNPSQLVMFRNFETPKFDVKEDQAFLQINTRYFSISYVKEKPFEGSKMVPSNNLRVELNNTEKSWFYKNPEVRNYKGVFVSFDYEKEVEKFYNGLYSIDGFATFDDTYSMIFQEDGTLVERPEKYLDIYVFLYDKDYNLALEDYIKLTGNPPLIPRYALGNWWCRDLAYKTDEILDVVGNFEKEGIPLSIVMLDKKWHIDNSTPEKATDSGFTFNKELIQNPEELIDILHEKNIRVGLAVNPMDGIFPTEEHYREFANRFKIEGDKIIALDSTNSQLVDEYIKNFLHPLEDIGADFFFNDYNPTDKKILPLWCLNHFMYTDFLKNQSKRGMLLSRNAIVASHRYPISYSGKTLISWDTLKKIPLYNQMASNVGVSFVSHDVGGNYGGIEEEELYTRYIELSCFLPILRFHAPAGRYYRKEPWRWNIKTLKTAKQYLNLRHKLIPYLYTEAYKYSKTGVPLVRPFYYKYPFVYDDKDFKNQYFFGDSLMVAPILSKQEALINRTIHRFFIPDGIWYDFITGKKFPGNKEYVSFYKLEDFPVFASSGSIIPISISKDLNNITNPTDLEIHVFPGKSNIYNLYEDDGVTSLYKDGYYLLTQIDYNYLPSNYTVIIRSLEGKSGIVPDFRNYKIRFRNTKKAQQVIAYYNDGMIKTISYVDGNDFIVELNQVPTVGQITVNCKGKDIEIDAVRLINDDIDSILLDLQINTVLKEKISLIMFSDLPLKRKRIEIRKLKSLGLSKKYIRLFLRLLEYIGQI